MIKSMAFHLRFSKYIFLMPKEASDHTQHHTCWEDSQEQSFPTELQALPLHLFLPPWWESKEIFPLILFLPGTYVVKKSERMAPSRIWHLWSSITTYFCATFIISIRKSTTLPLSDYQQHHRGISSTCYSFYPLHFPPQWLYAWLQTCLPGIHSSSLIWLWTDKYFHSSDEPIPAHFNDIPVTVYNFLEWRLETTSSVTVFLPQHLFLKSFGYFLQYFGYISLFLLNSIQS